MSCFLAFKLFLAHCRKIDLKNEVDHPSDVFSDIKVYTRAFFVVEEKYHGLDFALYLKKTCFARLGVNEA